MWKQHFLWYTGIEVLLKISNWTSQHLKHNLTTVVPSTCGNNHMSPSASLNTYHSLQSGNTTHEVSWTVHTLTLLPCGQSRLLHPPTSITSFNSLGTSNTAPCVAGDQGYALTHQHATARHTSCKYPMYMHTYVHTVHDTENFRGCSAWTPTDSCAERRGSSVWADTNFPWIQLENGGNQKANFVRNNNAEG